MVFLDIQLNPDQIAELISEDETLELITNFMKLHNNGSNTQTIRCNNKGKFNRHCYFFQDFVMIWVRNLGQAT